MSASQYSRRDRSARRLRERGGAGIVRSHKEQTADHTPTPPANGPRCAWSRRRERFRPDPRPAAASSDYVQLEFRCERRERRERTTLGMVMLTRYVRHVNDASDVTDVNQLVSGRSIGEVQAPATSPAERDQTGPGVSRCRSIAALHTIENRSAAAPRAAALRISMPTI